MNPTQAYWNARSASADKATLDELNAARIDHELSEMNARSLRIGNNMAIFEVERLQLTFPIVLQE